MNENRAGDQHLSAAYEYIQASAGGAENTGPESITVEEGIDCREADSRFFNLCDRETGLNIIISKNSSILSCKIQDHELVVGQRSTSSGQAQENTWALGDRPFLRMAALAWNCHVRGAELLLSASNGCSSMVYELNSYNELNVVAKLKSPHLQHQVTYFNLNNAKEKAPIDGHSLIVQCNGNLNRIQVQETKLLNCADSSLLIPPRALVANLPFDLLSRDLATSNSSWAHLERLNTSAGSSEDAICDAIYSIESSSQLDFLNVKLQYNRRSLTFIVRSTSQQAATGNLANHLPPPQTSVSSSTGASQITSSSKRLSRRTPDQPCLLTEQAGSPTHSDASQRLNHCPVQPSPDELSIASSSSTCSNSHSRVNSDPVQQLDSSSITQTSSSIVQPTTTLRVRVRVTNFGVCIMPLMMLNYACTYRFAW